MRDLQGIRILHLAVVPFTIRQFVAPLMHEQRKAGAEVAACCAHGEFFDEVQAKGLRLIACPMSRRLSPFHQAAAFFRLLAILRRERPHVLHCHTPIAGLVGRLAGAWLGIPVRYYTVHGFHFHEASSWLQRLMFVGLERAGARLGHRMMFVSSEDCDTARKLRLAPVDRLHYVGNGVHVEHFEGAAGSIATVQPAIPPGAHVVGYVGRMVPEKGLCELVQAVGELRRLHGLDAHLLMVGGRLASDPPRGIAQLDALMAEAARAGWLHATGLVPDPSPFLRLMHTFCLPSYREGLPVALMEAMAAGLPCVASRIRGCRELIAHEETGLLIEPRDASGLASALERVARNPFLAQQLGNAARRRITDSFSFEAWIERIGTVYALDAAAIQSIREASENSASS